MTAPREQATYPGITVEYEDERHLYWINGEEVPSVTKILGVLDKPALPWWGMTVGAEGVAKLYRECQNVVKAGEILLDPVQALKDAKLTVNHQLKKAGQRGTNVHDLAEWVLERGRAPRDDEFPALPLDQQGYEAAFYDWHNDADFSDTESEVMVGSLAHGFAGRYDLDAHVRKARWVTDADRGEESTETFKGLGRLDFKTSKHVYESHMLQLEGYEEAGQECGLPPTDFRAVVHLKPDGTYQVVRSHATIVHWRAVHDCFMAMEHLKTLKPKKPRRRAAKKEVAA